MKVIQEETIRKKFDILKAYEGQRQGFIAHSQGRVISSVDHLNTNKGSLHIKSGMLEGDRYFFIKLATGFSENWRNGLPSGDGCIVGFASSTGTLEAILIDRGYLTDLRTALAARLCIETYRPSEVNAIGILGTGVQARLCALHQAHATGCRKLFLWGKTLERVNKFKQDLEAESFEVTIVERPDELLKQCDVVITATSSREALLTNTSQRRTRLIVALGADETGKQELDPNLVASAQLLIADDVTQSTEIGEFQHAVQLNQVKRESIQSLGSLLSSDPIPPAGLVICDLSGLPIQDTQIAKTILENSYDKY